MIWTKVTRNELLSKVWVETWNTPYENLNTLSFLLRHAFKILFDMYKKYTLKKKLVHYMIDLIADNLTHVNIHINYEYF